MLEGVSIKGEFHFLTEWSQQYYHAKTCSGLFAETFEIWSSGLQPDAENLNDITSFPNSVPLEYIESVEGLIPVLSGHTDKGVRENDVEEDVWTPALILEYIESGKADTCDGHGDKSMCAEFWWFYGSVLHGSSVATIGSHSPWAGRILIGLLLHSSCPHALV